LVIKTLQKKKDLSPVDIYSARLKSSRASIEAVINYANSRGAEFRNAPFNELFNEIELEFSNVSLLRAITALYRAGFRSSKELAEKIFDSVVADSDYLAGLAKKARWLISAREIIGRMKQLDVLTKDEMQEGFAQIKGFLNDVQSEIHAQRFAAGYIFKVKGNRTISDSEVESTSSYLNSALSYGEGTQLVSVPWRILPAGEYPFPAIVGHFECLAERYKDFKLEIERLRKIFDLEPILAIIGEDEFDRYAIFLFKDSDKAVLECPYYGNATYIIKGDWISLSKLTKKELIKDYPRKYHSDDWFSWLKKSLGQYARTK